MRRENLRILHNLAHEPKTYAQIGGTVCNVAARIKRMSAYIECVGLAEAKHPGSRQKLWALTPEGRRYVVANPLPVNAEGVRR